MIFTKRERRIAILTLGCVGAFAVYAFGVSPLLDYRQGLAVARTQAEAQRDREKTLLNRRGELQQAWTHLRTTGLKPDKSEADSQLVHALYDYGPSSGMNVSSLNPDRAVSVQNDKFLESSFHATATGNMGAVSKMLWRLESAPPFPLRINSVKITSRKEGTDDVSVQLNVSTLCLNPDADKVKGAPAPKEKTTP